MADNGLDWVVSVARDPRIAVLDAELRRVKGSALEAMRDSG